MGDNIEGLTLISKQTAFEEETSAMLSRELTGAELLFLREIGEAARKRQQEAWREEVAELVKLAPQTSAKARAASPSQVVAWELSWPGSDIRAVTNNPTLKEAWEIDYPKNGAVISPLVRSSNGG